MELNPYAPTKASLNEPGTPDDTQRLDDEISASRGRRFVNCLVDSVGLAILIFVVAVAIIVTNSPILNTPLAGFSFQIVMVLLYYVPAELLTGRTPGKIITRTRVVSRSGGPPTAKQIVGRTLLRLVPFDALTFFASGPGLHDRASGTRVVMSRNT